MQMEKNSQNSGGQIPRKDKKSNRLKLVIIAVAVSVFAIIIGAAFILLAHSYLARNIGGEEKEEERVSIVDPERSLVKVSLEGVRVDTYANQPVILLKEEEGNKYLPIWIGAPEAISISLELSGTKMPRPMTHDLMANVLHSLGAKVDRVVITSLEEDTFYSALILEDSEGNFIEVDSRPSDAIAIAIRVSCQILVDEEVMEYNGIEAEPAEEQYERLRI